MSLKEKLRTLPWPKRLPTPPAVRSTELAKVKEAGSRPWLDRLFSYFFERYLAHTFKHGVHIKIDGRLVLESTTDLILLSGREPNGEAQLNPKRPGYYHSIWSNPSFNADGDPLLKIAVYDENEQVVFVDAQFDEEGILRPCQRLLQVRQPNHLEG